MLEDGRLLHVTDLRSQLSSAAVLSVTEYAQGRVRALYPTDSIGFEAGSAWFERSPVSYRVHIDESRRPAPGLTQENGRTLTGRRAPLRKRVVAVQKGAIVLADTLVLPPGRGIHPALVLVSGSGPESRRIPRQMGDNRPTTGSR